MMPTKVAMTWTGDDTLLQGIKGHDQAVRRVIAGEFMYHRSVAEIYAKEHAPWTDRSGNARSGLFAVNNFGENYWELILAHSVYYGIFLEVCNSGKYQIIQPTILYVGTLLLERLSSAMAALEARNGA